MSINSIFAGSTPNSRDTIRQQYLNTLTLDIANQTKNLNANKLFKANGSTGSEPADTRSATEKYEDLDNLKVQVRAGLKQITDGMEAERVVADITTAELQFLAGQLPFIVADLKPKWALGVPAGSFLPYLRKLMRKNIETEGVEYGLQSASNVGGGVESTAVNMISSREIEELGRELDRGGGRGGSQRRSEAHESRVRETLRLLDSLRTTAEDREVIASLHNPDILEEFDEDVATVAQNLPSYRVIQEAINTVPLQASMAKFEAIFSAVDWEMMRGLKGAVARFRTEIRQSQPPQYEEDRYATEMTGLSELGGDSLRNVPPIRTGLNVPVEEQPEGDLPTAYIRPIPAERINQLSAFAEEIPPEDFNDQTYNTKMELLRTYADEGKFNNMDAGFLHMINAIMEGHDVPERDMISGYSKFFRLKQLGGLTDKGEMPQLPPSKVFQTEQYPPVEQYPPTRQPTYQFEDESEMPEEEDIPTPKYLQPPYSNFKTLNPKSKRLLLTQMLTNNEFGSMPDFEDVATEIVSTKTVPDELLDNFFDAFLDRKGVGGQPLYEPPMEEEEEEFTIYPKKKEKKLPQIQEEKEYNPVDIEEFRQLSRDRQKAILQTLLDAPPEVQIKIDKLASIPQKKTMEYLYEQYLLYRPSGVALTQGALKGKAGPESSGKKASSVAGTTDAETYSLPSASLSGATEVLGGPKMERTVSSSKVHYPKTVSEYEKMNITQQKAILDRAYGDGVVDSEDLDPERAIVIQDLIRGDKLTKAQSKEIYASLLPVIRDLQSQGMIGIGLPEPHHLLGKHGYGLKKPASNDVIHIDFEKGSLPKGKKKGNIIFGMGLASVIPQPKVKVSGKNINLSAGIEAEPAYVPFGTHLLNKHRLKDNIVMMRTKKGGAIVNIPTQKVSGKLAKILHTISGGGIPQFESVMDLIEGDKALLHQIAKTSKVSDRLSVPNPNKSKIEEEDNRFNILRGEVSIGNDNPAVIKEFKVLLLKFMREGRVPTGQGKAIMEELLLMGY